MTASRQQPARKRLETWLWTGPLGHLLGGGLDLSAALLRRGLARATRALRRAPPPRGQARPGERSGSGAESGGPRELQRGAAGQH